MTTFSRAELRAHDNYANAARHASLLAICYARASVGANPQDLPLSADWAAMAASVQSALIASVENPLCARAMTLGMIEAAAGYLLSMENSYKNAHTLREIEAHSSLLRLAAQLEGPSA